MPRVLTEKFLEKADDVLDFGKYRKTLMAMKVLTWEIQRLVTSSNPG
jgi:hypothetical protein